MIFCCPTFLDTGQIGSRPHLAENVWLVSLGCSEGAQRSCRTTYTESCLGCRENPYFGKLAAFPYMHVKMGWICPNAQNAPLATKWPPMYKKSCPSSRTEKLRTFLKNIFCKKRAPLTPCLLSWSLPRLVIPGYRHAKRHPMLSFAGTGSPLKRQISVRNLRLGSACPK